MVVVAFATFPAVEQLKLDPTLFEVEVNRAVVNTRSIRNDLCINHFAGRKYYQRRVLVVTNSTGLNGSRREGKGRTRRYTPNGAEVNVTSEVNPAVDYLYPLSSIGCGRQSTVPQFWGKNSTVLSGKFSGCRFGNDEVSWLTVRADTFVER